MSSATISQKGLVAGKTVHRAWWKECTIYQIYPASFKDSNDDGIGDIPGILSKLDYIKKLGIDVVWLCPAYKSPQVDMGYDISDYYDIADQYGTVKDMERLIAGCHERGMKLLMDLVANHSSDQHEWFKQSRSSMDNPFRNWYIWKPPRFDESGNRHPPNNWLSHFQGSVWEYDETTSEYYLHLFAKEQPDLNWEHQPVRQAVYDIMRFWLNKGVDGFRMDVINFISKDQAFPGAPVQKLDRPWQWGHKYYANGPRLHEYLRDIGKILKEYDAFSVGEMPFAEDAEEVLRTVRYDRNELNMIFQFDHVHIDHGQYDKFDPVRWRLRDLKAMFEKWQKFMYLNDGWNALFWENHDVPRSIDRYLDATPEFQVAAAKVLATTLSLMSGTLFIYQGQELGMRNVPSDWGIDQYKDIDCLRHWEGQLERQPYDAKMLQTYRKQYQKKSRDNARIPMQWSAAPNAGFTSPDVTPWMSVHPNHVTINAEAQVSDPDSAYNFWAQLLRLRKQYADIFIYGDFTLLNPGSEDLFTYMRQYEDQKAVVVCNWTDSPRAWDPFSNNNNIGKIKEVLLNSCGTGYKYNDIEKWPLQPYEATVMLIE